MLRTQKTTSSCSGEMHCNCSQKRWCGHVQTLNLTSSFPFLFFLVSSMPLLSPLHTPRIPKHTNAQINVTSSESVGSCWKWRLHQAGHHTRVHLSFSVSPDISYIRIRVRAWSSPRDSEFQTSMRSSYGCFLPYHRTGRQSK